MKDTAMNNNPLSLPNDGHLWQGVDYGKTTRRRYAFTSMAMGYRAVFSAIRLWMLRGKKLGLGDVLERLTKGWDEIDRWYVRRKIRILTGLSLRDAICPLSADTMLPLVGVLAEHRLGKDFSLRDLNEGWRLFMG